MAKPWISALKYHTINSPFIALAGGGATIDIDVDPTFVHSFAGIVFSNDSGGEPIVQPTAGTITLQILTVLQPHVFQSFPSNILQADVADQTDWASNTLTVRAIIAGIVGATHARLIWAGNSA